MTLSGDTQQQDMDGNFAPILLFAEASGYYHINEKTGDLHKPRHTAQLTQHLTKLLLSQVPSWLYLSMPHIRLVFAFAFWGEGYQVLGGEKEPERQISLCCCNTTIALPRCTMKYRHGETQDLAPPAPTSFPDEAELRSQSMNTRKDEHTLKAVI